MSKFEDSAVADVFAAYEPAIRKRLLELRQLILKTAASTEGAGRLAETLKWGQPSYLTPDTKSGSTIRIDRYKKSSDRYAMFFHCQSNLVSAFREIYGDQFTYEGNRALIFDTDQPLPAEPLQHCIAMALTYHLRKKRKRAG